MDRTNGGPGCSSLEGLLQENGVSTVFIESVSRASTDQFGFGLLGLQPFSWSWGQAHPTQNEFSWTNLSSILYLEQPVGTGFSQGRPNITVGYGGLSPSEVLTTALRTKMTSRRKLSGSCSSSLKCSLS